MNEGRIVQRGQRGGSARSSGERIRHRVHQCAKERRILKTRTSRSLPRSRRCQRACRPNPIVVGSKKFTESYVLGEIAKTVLERAGFAVQQRAGMGGTIILWQALQRRTDRSLPGIYRHDRRGDSEDEGTPLGRRDAQGARTNSASECRLTSASTTPTRWSCGGAEANRLGIQTISDLRQHPELKIGLTHEFLDRQDGWRPLATPMA